MHNINCKKLGVNVALLFLTLFLSYFSLVTIAFSKEYIGAENSEIGIELSVSGKRNAASRGTEFRIVEINVDGEQIDLSSLADQNVNCHYDGGTIVLYEGSITIDVLETENIEIILLKHPWSGIVNVKVDSKNLSQEIDLYSKRDDTTSFVYEWDTSELWARAYQLEKLAIGEIVVYGLILIIIIGISIKLQFDFYCKIVKGKLKFRDIVKMLISLFIICLLTLYTLFKALSWGLIIIIYAFAFTFLWINRKKLDDKIHYMFVILYSITAVLWIFFLPPGHVPDEYAHFVKVYEASVLGESYKTVKEGSENLGEVYIYLPESLNRVYDTYMSNALTYNVKYNLEEYYSLYFDKLEKDNVVSNLFWFGNTEKLSISTYLIDIFLQICMTQFCIPPILCMQILRLVHGLFYITFGFLIIKKVPYYKRIFMLIMLLPMTIQQSIGINQDWITNLVAFAVIAYVIWIYDQQNFSVKDFTVLFVLSILLGNVKAGYFGVIFLVLVIPSNYFKNRWNAWINKFLIIVPCIIFTAISYLSAVERLNTNAPMQYYEISFIFEHPLQTVKIFIDTLMEQGYELFLKGLITGFGWYEHYTKLFLSSFESILIVIMLLGANEKSEKKIQIFCMSIFALISTFLFTSLFLCWTPDKSALIDGLQPRYFIIPVLCFGISMQNSVLNINIKNKNLSYMTGVMVILCNAILTVAMGYYK